MKSGSTFNFANNFGNKKQSLHPIRQGTRTTVGFNQPSTMTKPMIPPIKTNTSNPIIELSKSTKDTQPKKAGGAVTQTPKGPTGLKTLELQKQVIQTKIVQTAARPSVTNKSKPEIETASAKTKQMERRGTLA